MVNVVSLKWHCCLSRSPSSQIYLSITFYNLVMLRIFLAKTFSTIFSCLEPKRRRLLDENPTLYQMYNNTPLTTFRVIGVCSGHFKSGFSSAGLPGSEFLCHSGLGEDTTLSALAPLEPSLTLLLESVGYVVVEDTCACKLEPLRLTDWLLVWFKHRWVTVQQNHYVHIIPMLEKWLHSIALGPFGGFLL